MFPFVSKKPEYVLMEPALCVTRSVPKLISDLKAAGAEYQTVTSGYIVFPGKLRHCDSPVMIGIHYNALLIASIEVFRPAEYYQAVDYDINVSFRELSQAMRKEFGIPIVSGLLNSKPRESWNRKGLRIRHYMMDRFGPEEHLHIYLSAWT